MNSLSLYLGNVEKFNTNSSVRGDAVSSAGYETREREGVFSPDLEAVKYVPGEQYPGLLCCNIQEKKAERQSIV